MTKFVWTVDNTRKLQKAAEGIGNIDLAICLLKVYEGVDICGIINSHRDFINNINDGDYTQITIKKRKK